MCYIIIKTVEKDGIILPVIMLDSQAEVWEFETKEQADSMAAILQTNSHTNTRYYTKEI